MISDEGTRACWAGDTWVWEVSSLDGARLVAKVIEDTCRSPGQELTVVRCDPEKETRRPACEPVDWVVYCELASFFSQCRES